MQRCLTSALALASLTSRARAAPAAEWRGRAIYQVLTDRFAAPQSPACEDIRSYCGGTWAALAGRLDYIQALGFDAVWVSPVVDNAPGGFHGYWQRRMHDANANFGAWEDVRALADALHARGMFLMVDVVANHAWASGGDVSANEPFNSTAQYHDCNGCPNGCSVDDYEDHAQMEHCRLAGLMDFDNTDTAGPVATELFEWAAFLVNATNADGLRVDTVPYVLPAFWRRFEAAAGVYCVGEVDTGDLNFAAPYQVGAANAFEGGALSGVLSYPLFFTLRSVFAQRQSMRALGSAWRAAAAAWGDPSLLGVFTDNHDNARWLSGGSVDVVAYRAALAYSILSDGIPIVYYGTEWLFDGGNDPENREAFWLTHGASYDAAAAPLGSFLAALLRYRRSARLWDADAAQLERWQDDYFYAFTKGDGVIAAFTNGGAAGGDQARDVTYLPAAWPPGTRLCSPLDCTVCATVAAGPVLRVTVKAAEGYVVLDPRVAQCA